MPGAGRTSASVDVDAAALRAAPRVEARLGVAAPTCRSGRLEAHRRPTARSTYLMPLPSLCDSDEREPLRVGRRVEVATRTSGTVRFGVAPRTRRRRATASEHRAAAATPAPRPRAEERPARQGAVEQVVGGHPPILPASWTRTGHRVHVHLQRRSRSTSTSRRASRCSRCSASARVISVKDGCAPQGQCGCCTVLVDGDAAGRVRHARRRASPAARSPPSRASTPTPRPARRRVRRDRRLAVRLLHARASSCAPPRCGAKGKSTPRSTSTARSPPTSAGAPAGRPSTTRSTRVGAETAESHAL